MFSHHTTHPHHDLASVPATKKLFERKSFNVQLNSNLMTAIVALYLVLTANVSFFSQVASIYPIQTNFAFLVSMIILLFGLMWFVLQLVSFKITVKPVLIVMVIIASICAYFTDEYGTIFDRSMLINGLQTDQAEARDLLSPLFLLRVTMLGVLPAIVISRVSIKPISLKWSATQKIGGLLLALALMGGSLFAFGNQYASFFRQHKEVRYYANPITPLYSSTKLGMDIITDMRRPNTLTEHATDAKRIIHTKGGVTSTRKPKLMVFVVGETVRSDHLGLNGYHRNTTPLLSKADDLYSFKNVTSCGTSTAYSVPCMFSYADQETYDMDLAKYNENVLDTLQKQGVNVVWRDNNSSSKGVADRVTMQDFKTAEINPVCDVECRDIGMLDGLDALVQPKQDTLIVMHQMGNHGPAYYKRYPKEFEVFKPVCQSSELSKCDNESVINGYDNAILYTDFFLNSVIDALKDYEQAYDVMMVYVSDHGESLGENNVYLHGMPYKIAPKAQKTVPTIIWSPKSNHIDNSSFTHQVNNPVSHDYITPTLLNYFDITTQEVASKPTFFSQKHD